MSAARSHFLFKHLAFQHKGPAGDDPVRLGNPLKHLHKSALALSRDNILPDPQIVLKMPEYKMVSPVSHHRIRNDRLGCGNATGVGDGDGVGYGLPGQWGDFIGRFA